MRLIGLSGWSGSGKTTLLTALIPVLIGRGHSVSTIKHAHHEFDVDTPGKDSYVHRQAGAREAMISSQRRWALMRELRGAPEPDLRELLSHLSEVDLVLIEGFKLQAHPKIEIHRSVVGKPLLHPHDDRIVAIASDTPLPEASVPWLSLGDVGGIADIIVEHALEVDRIDWG